MKIKGFITLLAKAVFHKARSTALNLNTATCFLLYMLDVLPAVANDGCT